MNINGRGVEVRIRRVCEQCGGTMESGLSYLEAAARANNAPCGNMSPRPTANDYMKCQRCTNGYIEDWISLNELLSAGVD